MGGGGVAGVDLTMEVVDGVDPTMRGGRWRGSHYGENPVYVAIQRISRYGGRW